MNFGLNNSPKIPYRPVPNFYAPPTPPRYRAGPAYGYNTPPLLSPSRRAHLGPQPEPGLFSTPQSPQRPGGLFEPYTSHRPNPIFNTSPHARYPGPQFEPQPPVRPNRRFNPEPDPPLRYWYAPPRRYPRRHPTPSSAAFAQANDKPKFNEGPIPPHVRNERSLRRQQTLLSKNFKKAALKREASIRKLKGPGCMPGGLRPVLSAADIQPSGTADPAAPAENAQPTPAPAPTPAPPRREPTEVEFLLSPGDYLTRLVKIGPFFGKDDSAAIPDRMDVDDDDIFNVQMAALKDTSEWRKGLTEQRALLRRAEVEQFGPKLLAKQRARKAQAEKEEREREEREAERIRRANERLLWEAKVLEDRLKREAREREERLEREARAREAKLKREAKEREERLKREEQERAERLIREALEREERLKRERLEQQRQEEARKVEEERQRQEHEAKAKAEQETAQQREQAAFAEGPNSIMYKFYMYDGKWAELAAGYTERKLAFAELPWPSFLNVTGPDDITESVLTNFFFHLNRPGNAGKSPRQILKAEAIRWHPDRFDTKVLTIMEDTDKDLTMETAGQVARVLTRMLNNS